MIKIYDTENCAKCRLTERLFNVANVDFEVVKPHNEDIERFRDQGFQSYPVVETPNRSWCGFRPDLIKKEESIMNFGEALEELKRGNCVARKGWNGKDQFIYLIKAQELSTGLHYGFGEYYGEPRFVDVLAMKTSKGDIQVGWLASQTDMLADDWALFK